ncbi:zinc finger CCCH domain-containing protein 26-like isoform X2 [Hibiscus syriacus]|uniref:zinc finger CCCH domain-containing protein 26-like isoform X2 n=1 Tax=Hibiscus syriacus TaxID=106335 RepID=UPI0019226BDE|nr:zinc finger CCCH domain-containing protein 26-like isoform X2 [Hibiscus syriacus]
MIGAGPVIFNILGLPIRQDEKPCPYYMQTGSCKFGIACKFHHPQPASPGAGLPVNGPVRSLILPPSNLPYAGGLTTWPLPRAPYVSGPRLHSQSYMPVIVSPSQSMIPTLGWSTYMGTKPCIFCWCCWIQFGLQVGESSRVRFWWTAALDASSFPERPDQPECRYYMSTGTCKYESDCKYHHPKERIANSAVNGIGPLGLPSRPGRAVCSSYTIYGLCKYGPTCRFDHPPFVKNSSAIKAY